MHLQDPSGSTIPGSKRSSATPDGAVIGLYLSFRNYYAAVLRLVQVNRDGSFAVLLEEHPLMLHVHCEDDAQKWHVIPLDKVCGNESTVVVECGGGHVH